MLLDEKINLLDCFDDERTTRNVDDKSDEIKSNKSFQIIGKLKESPFDRCISIVEYQSYKLYNLLGASFGVITVLMATIYKWFIDE